MRSVGDVSVACVWLLSPQLNFGTANTTTETIRVAPGTNYPQQEVEGNWRLYFIVILLHYKQIKRMLYKILI